MVELSNTGKPVSTVGELLELLVPFMDECQINNLRVFYVPDDNGSAKLEIRLAG